MPPFDPLSTAQAADALEALQAILASPVAGLLTGTARTELENLRASGRDAITARVQQLDGLAGLARIWADDDTDWTGFYLPGDD